MTKQKILFDFENNAIMVEVNYLKSAKNPKTAAYKKLHKMTEDNPTAKIVSFGTRRDNYNRITIDQMKGILESNGEEEALKELDRMLNCGLKVLGRNKRPCRMYNMGAIRKWFMDLYKDKYTSVRNEGQQSCTNQVKENVAAMENIEPLTDTEKGA